MWVCRAYPHVCGATVDEARAINNLEGLSPRVWGNRRKQQRQVDALRPIPTCVGQPATGKMGTGENRAYPHVCGATPCVLPVCG